MFEFMNFVSAFSNIKEYVSTFNVCLCHRITVIVIHVISHSSSLKDSKRLNLN